MTVRRAYKGVLILGGGVGVVLLGWLLAHIFQPSRDQTQSSSPIWQPTTDARFQWQLSGEFDPAVDADVYDLDLFTTTTEQVAALKATDRHVICYVNVGAWEDFRPDKAQFPPSTIGSVYVGYDDERWLDIRRIEDLAPVLRARFDLCRAKGFDGLEPDNIDGYQNETGFALTARDQLRFNRWLAAEVHARGLSIGLKNDPDQVGDLAHEFDWALTEDCFVDGWCEALLPFRTAGKAVFMVEYTDREVTLDEVCSLAARLRFSAILKHRDLDGFRDTCP